MEQEFINSGLVFYLDQNYKSAVEEFTKAIEKGESSQALFFRGKTYIEIGNYENAIKDLTAALNTEKENTFEIFLQRAKALFLMQNYKEANEDVKKGQEIKNITEEQKERLVALQTRFS